MRIPRLPVGQVLLLLVPTILFGQTFPLQVSTNNRYLEDQASNSFLMVGDSPWSLMVVPTYAKADEYLSARDTLGFNTILVQLIENEFGGPANANGDSPFSGTAFQSAENEDYFLFCDSVIDRATALGFTIMLFPAYIGYECGAEGWCAEIQAASVAQMKSWGEYAGNRYKNNPNIIWVISGDAQASLYAGVREKLDSVARGIKLADTVYPNRIMTTHNQPWSTAVDDWDGSGGRYWLTLNSIYHYDYDWYDEANAVYSVSPTMPFYALENWYEASGDLPSAQELRAQSYWTTLAGGIGHTFGNFPMWYFGAGWEASMDDQGSLNMWHYGKLFQSRYWHKLVPDITNTVLTSGYGTGTTLATAAKASDGSSIIAYSPDSKTLTFDPTTMMGDSVRVYLFNPATGGVTFVGNEDTGDNFTVATTGERVVVIDSENYDNFFAAPGGATPLPRKKVMAYYNQWLQQLSPSWKVPWQIDWSGIDYVVHFYDGDAVFTSPPYLRVLKDSAFGGTHTLPDSILIQHWFTDCGLGCYPVNYQDSLIKYVHLAGGKVLFDLQDVIPNNLNVVMSDSTASQVLADGMMAYIQRKGYDGYEIDAESWSVPTPGDEEAGYARFVRMTNRIDPNVEVFISGSTGAWNDWNTLDTSLVDGWVVQTYEFEFAWDSNNSWNANWYLSPLRSTGVPAQINGQSINTLGPPQWVNTTGVPKQKMWIGIPAYGRQLLGSNDGLFERWTGGITYDSYATITGLSGTKFFDDNAKVPRIEHGTSFATFEDSLSIWWKMKYVMDSSYAGVFVYDMDNDGGNRNVLNWSMQIRDNFSEGAAASVPTVTTTAISNVTTTTMSSGGNVTDDGGATVTARGVCWNYTGTPTVEDNTTSDGSGTGSFTSSITGLQGNKTVYVRAYATNSVGDGYGTEVNSTTSKYMRVLK